MHTRQITHSDARVLTTDIKLGEYRQQAGMLLSPRNEGSGCPGCRS